MLTRKQMKLSKKILILVVILLLVAQFVQPVKNVSEGLGADDISKVYDMPADLHKTFVNKCYDCHSNNTHYPWYFNIQPIGWWLAAHVNEGKEHLDFSSFRKYDKEKAEHQLEEISEVVEDHSMPIKAYVLFHPESELTEADEKAINSWLKSLGAVDE
jgi:hypothetical protein